MSTIAQERETTGLAARQKLTALGRIALWSSVMRFMIASGGLVTLLILSKGAGLRTSQDVIGIASGSLLAAIVLATRTSWSPWVSTLLTGFVFFLTARDPYELSDLINPKGPNGGFPVFFMDVVVMALALLAFGGSLGLTLDKFRPLPRWVAPLGFTLIIGMIIGATYIGALR